MLPSLRALLSALTRLRPRRNWFLGTPQRATIAAVAPAGYILLIDYTNGRDWVTLPARRPGEEWTALSTAVTDDRPDERELTAVDAALADRRLIRTQPWGIDNNGRLCADIAVIHPQEGAALTD
jgi:hypothetical protein